MGTVALKGRMLKGRLYGADGRGGGKKEGSEGDKLISGAWEEGEERSSNQGIIHENRQNTNRLHL
jgi:hypothetical protein